MGPCEGGAAGSASPLTCFLVSLVRVGRLALLARRRLWVVVPAFCSLLRSEWKSPTRLVHPTLYLPESGEREKSEPSQRIWASGREEQPRQQSGKAWVGASTLTLNPSPDTTRTVGRTPCRRTLLHTLPGPRHCCPWSCWRVAWQSFRGALMTSSAAWGPTDFLPLGGSGLPSQTSLHPWLRHSRRNYSFSSSSVPRFPNGHREDNGEPCLRVMGRSDDMMCPEGLAHGRLSVHCAGFYRDRQLCELGEGSGREQRSPGQCPGQGCWRKVCPTAWAGKEAGCQGDPGGPAKLKHCLLSSILCCCLSDLPLGVLW